MLLNLLVHINKKMMGLFAWLWLLSGFILGGIFAACLGALSSYLPSFLADFLNKGSVIFAVIFGIVWMCVSVLVQLFVLPPARILFTIDDRLDNIAKRDGDYKLDFSREEKQNKKTVNKFAIVGALIGIALVGCGLCAVLNRNVFSNELKFFDNRYLNEKEWNEIQSASREINHQLKLWADSSLLANWENNSQLNKWKNRHLSKTLKWESQEKSILYETSLSNVDFDVDKKAFKVSESIRLTLGKEYAGCPLGSVYELSGIHFSNDSNSFDRYFGSNVQRQVVLPKIKTYYKKIIEEKNCEYFISESDGEEATQDLRQTPRQETLYLGGQQWGAPATFNPLAESWMAAWPVGRRFNLVYEPLVNYNTLNGQIEDLLGHLVEELSNNDSVVVDLNPAAKWSDGKQVNSHDVKFMFTKGPINPSLIISAIHVDTIASEPTIQERLSFIVNKAQRNNPLSVRDLLQAIRIAPAHIFEPLIAQKGLEKVKNIQMDKDLVVSGPYNLKEYSTDYIVLVRRDDYWGNAALHNGKLPSPKYIVHPMFHSSAQLTFALKEGNLDCSNFFIPYIWNYERMGVHAWYKDSPYYVPASMQLLVINTMKKPLNDKRFRRALAMAIDYTAMRVFGTGNYTTPLQPGLIVPTSIEGKFIDKEDAKKYGVNLSFSSEKKRIKVVKKMLAEAGYKSVYKEDGSLDYMEDSLGSRLPTLYITSPAGWDDWEPMVTVAVEGMRVAGIDVREKFVDGSEYWPAMGVGNFDLIMHKPAADVSPSLPWSRFNEVMSSRDWKPLGEWAGTNIGRYNRPGADDYRPEVDSLLAKIPLITDSVEIAEAYRELNQVFMEDQPAIPLSYVPEQYYECSDKVWTNWPNEENSYAPPQMPGIGTGTNILWNIRPR